MIKAFIKVYNLTGAFAVWAYLIIPHSKQFFLRFDNREVCTWPRTNQTSIFLVDWKQGINLGYSSKGGHYGLDQSESRI